MSPDPCHPACSTSACSNSPDKIAGRNRFNPVLVLISDLSFAWRKTSFCGDLPASASRIGWAKSWNVTMVEIGFPGRPKKYFHCGSAFLLSTLEEESQGTRPNTIGFPG